MRKYMFIGCGSFIGAVLRYLIKGIPLYTGQAHVPLNTLFVNVLGSFIMVFILTIAFESWPFDPDIRLGVTTGFLGAFTTFSTLCRETVGLMQSGDYFPAISYMTASIFLGLLAAYLGIVFAREIGAKLFGQNKAADKITERESDVG